jgi:L-aspartate oxidase
MWDYVGIVRTNDRLRQASRRIEALLKEIQPIYEEDPLSPSFVEVWNMLQAAQLIVKSALRRKESRGLHYNLDYPAEAAKPKRTILVRRA